MVALDHEYKLTLRTYQLKFASFQNPRFTLASRAVCFGWHSAGEPTQFRSVKLKSTKARYEKTVFKLDYYALVTTVE